MFREDVIGIKCRVNFVFNVFLFVYQMCCFR